MSGTSENIPEELHVLAGEYVLGALEASEMRAVRRQAIIDPTLAAAIANWERRLAPLAATVPPLPPPDALWSRIEATIGPVADESAPAPAAAALPVRRFPAILPDEAPPARPPRQAWLPEAMPPPPPRRVWPWQAATVLSLALAAGVAALVLVPGLAFRANLPGLAERFAPQVAALMPADTPTPGFLAEARPDGTVLLTALAPVAVPAGKDLELWILPPGGTAPRSLGLLPARGRQVTLQAMPAAGTALMVSLEPPGGSPTGAPTGPVVYAGKLGQMRL